MKKGIKEKKAAFDYANFEQNAIAQLRAGHDLIGKEGVLTELVQRIVNAALEGELTHHLKEEKLSGKGGNRRNGTIKKNLKTSVGDVEIERSRDRLGTFDPVLVKNWDRNLNTGLDTQILELYAKGNSVLDIQDFVEKLYGISISTGQISAVTEKIWEEVLAWKSRALHAFYVLIYLDAIFFKIRENGKVVTKAIYTVYGVNAQGERDILDIHIGQGDGEGAKEWGRLLEKIQNRGVLDVLFFAVDGLSGFSEAILEVYPQSLIQRCIVHMIRTSLKLVDDKDYRKICKDLKAVYSADDEAAAIEALKRFGETWDFKYPEIRQKWEDNWLELTTFFGFNAAIRRLIYTTNAVEGLHRKMRKVTKSKGAFVNDKALLKLLYLNLIRDPKSWKKKVFKWAEIKRGLIREFGDRFEKHLDDNIIIK